MLVVAIMFSIWVSVCLSVVRPSVLTSFPFDNLSIHKQSSFKFCICVCTKHVSLGIVNGQILIIYHRVMALVSTQKMLLFFACNSFTTCIGSIKMKLHKNDRSNKSLILT